MSGLLAESPDTTVAAPVPEAQRLRVLASKWISESPIRPREIRFDVAAVVGATVEILEGAF